jgi:hypothetical protein
MPRTSAARRTASITALILLVPSAGFMLFIERFLKADLLAKVGSSASGTEPGSTRSSR